MSSTAKISTKANGKVMVRPLPTLDALFGSLKGKDAPSVDESAKGWNARARRLMRK